MSDPDVPISRTPLERVWIGNNDVVMDPPARPFTHIVSIMQPASSRAWPGVKYLRLCFRDGDPDTPHLLRKFKRASDWVQQALADPRASVLIHCDYGVSRSASVVIYHMMRTTHMSFSVALNLLRLSRPCVDPCKMYAHTLGQWGCSFGTRLNWFLPVRCLRLADVPKWPLDVRRLVGDYCGIIWSWRVRSHRARELILMFESIMLSLPNQ